MLDDSCFLQQLKVSCNAAQVIIFEYEYIVALLMIFVTVSPQLDHQRINDSIVNLAVSADDFFHKCATISHIVNTRHVNIHRVLLCLQHNKISFT